MNILKIEKPDETNRDWSNKFTTDTPIESIKARIDADAEWIRQERQRPDYTGALEPLFTRWEEMVSKYALMQAQHQNDIMNSVAKSQLKRAELKSQITPPSQKVDVKPSSEVVPSQ